MIEHIVVGLIIAGAVGYIVYRYGFRKSGGCGCGCGDGSGGCPGNGAKTESSCSCQK